MQIAPRVAMYRRRGRQTEYQASIKRFLELSKDPLKRLKSLKHGHGENELSLICGSVLTTANALYFCQYGTLTACDKVERMFSKTAMDEGNFIPLFCDLFSGRENSPGRSERVLH